MSSNRLIVALRPSRLIAVADDRSQIAALERKVVEIHAVWQHHVEQHATVGGCDGIAELAMIHLRSSCDDAWASRTLIFACSWITP